MSKVLRYIFKEPREEFHGSLQSKSESLTVKLNIETRNAEMPDCCRGSVPWRKTTAMCLPEENL